MLTKIGRQIFASYSFNVLPHVDLSASLNTPAYAPVKLYTGDDAYTIPRFYNVPNFNLITALNNTGGVAFGSGTTPATENDFTIESLISDITASVSNAAYRVDPITNNYSMYIDYVISNNTSEPITISEICRFGLVRYATTLGGGVSQEKNALMDRTLLNNPVTIPAGEAGTVRYELVLN